ncbi:MAG: insulinase family protein [Flavobacteriales bacterium]|jgi:zinc protease|nr:insulinase family protein [Flavobacteriales bacterium]MBK6883857.1 insulinase family protein [Flavobacteriales bacterium]MBK7100249.1 insulinase family protein [Flavobacteriales bacterium]MBK7110942.1 insulinase family protein [Flavobacteriales bacterium]MBK7481317.1 insulinase family protein [Flavobacteriales bacterium]
MIRTRNLRSLACAGLLAPVLMNAQLDRSRPPVAGPAPVVHLGEHTSTTLSNGVHVIVVEDHKLPLVSVQLRFDIPPVHQSGMAGYVDMVGELLATGTATRTKAQIDGMVDSLGANFFATSDGVYAGALKKNLAPLMDLLTDVVQNPLFPTDELEKARTRDLSAVQQRAEDPEGIAEAVGRSVTFGPSHPYGEMHTERTIKAITRTAVEAYHRYYFRPENAYLVFVGDITAKEANDYAKKLFGKWKPAKSLVTTDEFGRTVVEGIGALVPLEKPTTPSGVRRVYGVDRPGAAQSVIRVSFPLNLIPKDIRAQQATVMNTILGGGIFNARLMQNLREKNGFTYGAYSSLEIDRFNSSLTATASVRTEVTDSAITEILLEIERLRNEPVTQAELDLAKSHMSGSFGRSMEDPKTVARFALNTELNGLSADHYKTYLSRLEGVTIEQVQDAANAFLHPDQAVILVVGDLEQRRQGLMELSMDGKGIIQLNDDGSPWEEKLTPVQGKVAEQVLETHIHAIGGREAIAPIRDLHIERQVVRGADTLSENEWFSAIEYRSILKRDGAVIEEYIHDGERVLYTDPEVTGELNDAGYEAIQLRGRVVPAMGYAKAMEWMELLGSTTLMGETVYKLRLRTAYGLTFAEYYNAESGLLVRRVDDFYYNGRQWHMTTDYNDWKGVNGVQFPHTIVEQGAPWGKSVRTIIDVEVGKPKPVTFFEVNIPEMPDLPVPPEMLPPLDIIPEDQ